jgi:hypothetical protein
LEATEELCVLSHNNCGSKNSVETVSGKGMARVKGTEKQISNGLK